MPGRKAIWLNKQTLSESAAEALRKAILNGQLKPGEWLRQEALAEEMGISQMTVRDALNQLVGEGLAVRIPYKGVRVVSLDVEDVENICAMRGLLEGLAAKLAAENITPEELEQMRKLLPETTISAERESVERARDANREFHEIAIRACRRPFLIRLLKQLWDWLGPYMLYGVAFQVTEEAREEMLKYSERDLERHVQLLEALEARDGEQARSVVEKYMQEVWESTKLFLQRLESSQSMTRTR
ncbi:MAG TPA: GntR family transcriptional regulator [Anaerolineae bacterium]|nr:GntR family transcriptional regulator [Anaerolineae bacterium]